MSLYKRKKEYHRLKETMYPTVGGVTLSHGGFRSINISQQMLDILAEEYGIQMDKNDKK